MDRSPHSLVRRILTIATLLPLGVVSILGANVPRAAAQTVTLAWAEWTPPSSYPNTGTVPTPFSYTYASTTLGELQLPDGPRVYIRLTGEIVNPALGTATTTCTNYCGPSGFTSNSTTRPVYWQTYPYSLSGAAFTSANVPFAELPPNGDHIGLVGSANGGNPTQTLEFFSDAARTTPATVRDIVMLVGSLGAYNALTAVWDFTQDFDILSNNSGADANIGPAESLVRTVKSPGGTGADFQLSGQEGAGAIQFVGDFTRISWTVSAPEVWASWNIGASSAPAPSTAAATAALSAPTPTLALDCTPDPVHADTTVTCEVTQGDAAIDILWRASIDRTFAELGVTLDTAGRGSFTFTAPSDAAGRTIDVELVDWGVTDRVAVIGGAVPSTVPAGDGPRVRSPLVMTAGPILVLFVGLVLRSRRPRGAVAPAP